VKGCIANPNKINKTHTYGKSTFSINTKAIATATEIIDLNTSIKYEESQYGIRVAPEIIY